MKPHVYPLQVQYEEIDSAGVVHHPNYLHFCERARTRMLKDAGYGYGDMLKDGAAVVVSEIHQKFLKPLRYEDDVVVVTRLVGWSRSSLRLLQLIFPSDTPEKVFHSPPEEFGRSRERSFAAQIRLVSVDQKTGSPVPLPEKLLHALGVSPEMKDPKFGSRIDQSFI